MEEVNTNVNEGVRLCERKTFNEFYTWIRTIDPLSDTQAWVSENIPAEIKLLSSQSKDIQCKDIIRTDFIAYPTVTLL